MVVVVVAVASIGASGAAAKHKPKPAVCALSQQTTGSKPCTANPAYGSAVCPALLPLLRALAPGVTFTPSANTFAPAALSCTFAAGGNAQALRVEAAKGAAEKQQFATLLAQATSSATAGTCPSGAPMAAPQAVLEPGATAFAWIPCAPPTPGVVLAAALRGTELVYVDGDPSVVSPTLDQFGSLLGALLAKYR